MERISGLDRYARCELSLGRLVYSVDAGPLPCRIVGSAGKPDDEKRGKADGRCGSSGTDGLNADADTERSDGKPRLGDGAGT